MSKKRFYLGLVWYVVSIVMLVHSIINDWSLWFIGFFALSVILDTYAIVRRYYQILRVRRG